MQNNLPPTSTKLNPLAPSTLTEPLLGWHARQKIDARWKRWVPWVWMYLSRHGIAPERSPELAFLQRRHADHIVAFTEAGVRMRLIRRHRLDDPRITDDLRAVLVRAARERQRKAWRARHHPRDWMAQLWGDGIRNRPLSLESPNTPSPNSREIILSPKEVITIASIKKRVCEHFYLRELRNPDLQVRSRRHVFVLARQLAMYIARQLTGISLQEIGRQFGAMHHTTVLHSINKIAEMRRLDEALDRTITRLMDAMRLE